MSTRSSYNINSHHFYVHCDGYPTGAAEKFKAMLKAWENQTAPNGTIQDAFIRGNDSAELIEHSNQVGDTEYHYNLVGGSREDTDPSHINISVIVLNRWSDEKPRILYVGNLAEFIKQSEQIERDEQNETNAQYVTEDTCFVFEGE